jgi:chromosome segregation ATPase
MAEVERIFRLESEIEELRVRVIEPLTARISELEQIAGELYRELDDIETQMDDCYHQRQNCERETSECQRRRVACGARLADIRAELGTHSRMRPSRRGYEEDDLQSFEADVQEWRRRGTELQSQLDDIEDEITDINNRENQLMELLQQLQDQIEELTRVQTRLARNLARSRAQLEDCRRQIGEALETVTRLETEVDNCRERIRQLQNQFNELVSSTREAIGQYDRVQQKISAERTRLQQGMEQSINNIRSRMTAEEAFSKRLIELALRFHNERNRFENLGNVANRQTTDHDAEAIGLSFQSADNLHRSQIQKWYRLNLYDMVGRSANFAKRYGQDLLNATHLITEAREI